jgi:hypothetical protein
MHVWDIAQSVERRPPVSALSRHADMFAVRPLSRDKADMRLTKIRAGSVISPGPAAVLEHDPEKWVPVFRKDHAQTKR